MTGNGLEGGKYVHPIKREKRSTVRRAKICSTPELFNVMEDEGIEDFTAMRTPPPREWVLLLVFLSSLKMVKLCNPSSELEKSGDSQVSVKIMIS